MVGVFEVGEGDGAVLVFCGLLVSGGGDAFGDEAVAAGDFAGDLGLFHGGGGVEATEEGEEVGEGEDDEYQKEEGSSDQDACVEIF